MVERSCAVKMAEDKSQHQKRLLAELRRERSEMAQTIGKANKEKNTKETIIQNQKAQIERLKITVSIMVVLRCSLKPSSCLSYFVSSLSYAARDPLFPLHMKMKYLFFFIFSLLLMNRMTLNKPKCPTLSLTDRR